MEPVAALLEIASLLERERASRYRAKAFRQAAAVFESLPADVRTDPNRLRAAPGIGASTFSVIRQAQEGMVPDYLVELRGDVEPERISDLRRKLRGDLHAHTDWSDGTTSIAVMAAAARAQGHEYQAITDHSPRLRVARGLSAERLREQIPLVRAESGDGFTLLAGIEVDILDDGVLDQEDGLLGDLDIVVASVHSKLRMDARSMTRRMLAAVAHPRVNVLGHCTGRLVQGERGTRPPSEFDAAAVFAACAENGVAVEINSRPERQDPPDELIALALEAGCLFSIDSDAHAPGQLSLLDHGAERAERAGVPASRIVTTWGLERLLAWAE
ncbi:PHP domain-containing protein [Microbacterium sp. kSW2-24]|jgi:putative hydrolase|uniref:PHP domain-containing protein n=1 Tax=Microbacterium TaxID=33882 RepID=UPI001FFCF340|nr:PHP domain-containing protein [Microbacterium galbinum]MCK2021393.1 PHP domain-containing protein [Microbacterium galbinum]